MGNRVEDLETQVAELQAAVDGLTEELVEAKERISQLERATAVEEESTPERNPNAEFVPNESATNGAADEGTMADDEGTAQKAARGGDGGTANASGRPARESALVVLHFDDEPTTFEVPAGVPVDDLELALANDDAPATPGRTLELGPWEARVYLTPDADGPTSDSAGRTNR